MHNLTSAVIWSFRRGMLVSSKFQCVKALWWLFHFLSTVVNLNSTMTVVLYRDSYGDFSLYWSSTIILPLQFCSLPYRQSLSFFVFFSMRLSSLNYQLWSTIVQKLHPKDPKLLQLTLPHLASKPHLKEYWFFSFLTPPFNISWKFIVIEI